MHVQRKTALITFAALVALLVTGAAPSAAQEQGADWETDWVALFTTAKTSTEIDHRAHLETLSCGEFTTIANSDNDNDKAVAAMVTVWAHGYHSGLQGINFQAKPMSIEGMVTLLRGLLDECGRHPDELFHTAVTKLD